MKHILFFILLLTAISVSAQEVGGKYKPIPAPKFGVKPKKTPIPETKNPETESLDIPSIKTPNVFENKTITTPSKFQIGEEKSKFSMSTENDFANPGDRYVDKMEKDLKRDLKEAGLSEERGPLTRKNIEFGDIYTSSAYFIVKCRDAGAIDGDLIKAVFNQNVVVERMILKAEYQSFKITFNEGFNTFELEALNIGTLGGNTGGFEIIDAEGNRILSDYWNNLDTGFKAKFIIVKQQKPLTKSKK
ncbi:hypothetical protein [Flavobacterium foetidum]|uniref:hypothetical protein n=1 Tax=Flavobacterium foetidum TaxID=2026681 RepID=UPI0010755338|nr:hypothetical protein [Flavobacterium foetidum]KAF2517628.1 hypothetical protein E0W73_00025 [Flavobacterium foetidum]